MRNHLNNFETKDRNNANLLTGDENGGNSHPEVNDIIVKIEMKKFQNLIANKIKHKNNLLQADMMRVYPLTKKSQGGMTLYD